MAASTRWNGEAPRVSFIVPSYNYGHLVHQAVESLLGQTFTDLEVIVIDDASQDDTATRLVAYRDHPRVRIVTHTENRGHILSYNEGLQMARGEYIGLLSADDVCLLADAVERQVTIFDQYPDVGFVYSAYHFIDANGRVLWLKQPWDNDYVRPGHEEFKDLAFEDYVPASGTLVRRTCHESLGYYDERLPHAGDWDLWLRIASRYEVGYVAAPLYGYRVHEANMHHSSVTPRQATVENALTMSRAFSAVRQANPHLLQLERGCTVHALLISTTVDRNAGRAMRAWGGLVAAIRAYPLILATPGFWGALARLVLLTALGHRRYVAIARRVGGEKVRTPHTRAVADRYRLATRADVRTGAREQIA